jgi:hypothetical protein
VPVEPLPAAAHPDVEPRRLVVLELEEVEHEVQPAGQEREQAERSEDQAGGGHPCRASRGCSHRKRRATDPKATGASA